MFGLWGEAGVLGENSCGRGQHTNLTERSQQSWDSNQQPSWNNNKNNHNSRVYYLKDRTSIKWIHQLTFNSDCDIPDQMFVCVVLCLAWKHLPIILPAGCESEGGGSFLISACDLCPADLSHSLNVRVWRTWPWSGACECDLVALHHNSWFLKCERAKVYWEYENKRNVMMRLHNS